MLQGVSPPSPPPCLMNDCVADGSTNTTVKSPEGFAAFLVISGIITLMITTVVIVKLYLDSITEP